MASIPQELPPISQRVYAEVWGDTVDLKHLAWAIGIGTGASVLGFYCAIQCLVTIIESEQWAYAYAMLAGLAGCIVAGTMGVKALFSKRLVTETAMSADLQWRRDVMAALAAQPVHAGAMKNLPETVVQELKALRIPEL